MDRTLADRLRRRILVALALGSACTDRDLDDTSGGADDSGDGSATVASTTPAPTDEGGSAPPMTTMPADDGEVDDGVVDESEVDDGEVDDDDDGGVHFDLGTLSDAGVPPPPPPSLDCDDPPPLPPDGACTIDEHDEYTDVTACFENLEGGACPLARTPESYDALALCVDACLYAICGPDPAHEPVLCCYWSIAEPCAPGRPFTVNGVDRLADARARDDWRDAIAIDVDSVPPALRLALARAWTEDARCEHAAVASFARFAIQLLALGAPADLVARAQRAMGDELRHARAFFGLASAYGDRPVGPGPLDTSDALADGTDLEHVVVATVREGCIAETISLVQLATAQADARDPALRSLLATIVEEELEHVELAWSFVGWALARGDARLHAAVAAAFAAAETAIPRSPAIEIADASRSRARGRLTAEERSSTAHATLRDVVRPCAARLLAGAPTTATHEASPAAG